MGPVGATRRAISKAVSTLRFATALQNRAHSLSFLVLPWPQPTVEGAVPPAPHSIAIPTPPRHPLAWVAPFRNFTPAESARRPRPPVGFSPRPISKAVSTLRFATALQNRAHPLSFRVLPWPQPTVEGAVPPAPHSIAIPTLPRPPLFWVAAFRNFTPAESARRPRPPVGATPRTVSKAVSTLRSATALQRVRLPACGRRLTERDFAD